MITYQTPPKSYTYKYFQLVATPKLGLAKTNFLIWAITNWLKKLWSDGIHSYKTKASQQISRINLATYNKTLQIPKSRLWYSRHYRVPIVVPSPLLGTYCGTLATTGYLLWYYRHYWVPIVVSSPLLATHFTTLVTTWYLFWYPRDNWVPIMVPSPRLGTYCSTFTAARYPGPGLSNTEVTNRLVATRNVALAKKPFRGSHPTTSAD